MPLPSLIDLLRVHLQRRGLLLRLRDAEAALPGARREHQRVLLNEMGDLHLALGDERTALACYGSAVDASLDVGHLDAAATLCRRTVKRCPGVVRMHGTLGSLLLVRGALRDAERELACYVQAARRQGTAGYARERLGLLSRAVAEREARLLLATLLRQVGDPATAEEVERGPEPSLTPEGQRRVVASVLRRQVQPRLSGSNSIEPAPAWRPAEELPLMDTSIGASRPATLRPADDLPWLDTALPARPTAWGAPFPAPPLDPRLAN